MRIRPTVCWLMTWGIVACGGSAIEMGGATDAGTEADVPSKGGAAGAAGIGLGGFPDASADKDAVAGQAGAAGEPNGYKFDVFNAQLNGAFATYESQRRQPILQTLATLDSDVLCVTEMWSDADKQALANAAKVYSFPYAYIPVTDWSTPISDPTDENGTVPEQPSTPACSTSIDKMTALLDCLRDKCMGGSEQGKADDKFKDCIVPSCGAEALLPLITGAGDDPRCWSCIFTQIASYETVASTRDQCANNVDAKLVFRGASNVMVLSRHPFASEPEVFVLPATEWQQVVVRVPLQMSNGASVDYYCGSATTPVTSCITRPYTGVYGGSSGSGLDCTIRWEAEQKLQAGKINKWVKSKSTRAIVAGDYYTGTKYTDGNVDVIRETHPEAYAKLTFELTTAVPVGYKPQCTFCPETNTLLSPPDAPVTGSNTWTSFNLIGNIAATDVTGAAIILKDAVVDGPSYKVPLSPYYGFRSIIDLKP